MNYATNCKIIAIVLLSASSNVALSKSVCTEEQVDKAHRSLDLARNWQDVFRSFAAYRQCDDGAIAEGYSDKIADLLVNNWSSAAQLFELWHSHPDFGRFVLFHIDELMSPEQAQAITRNARHNCPTRSVRYCRQLEAKVRNP